MFFNKINKSASKYFTRRNLGLAGVVLILGACASTSLFIPYPQQMASYKTHFSQGGISKNVPEANKALDVLVNKQQGPNSTLNFLESARIAQVNQLYDLSKQQFEKAIAAFRAEEQKAHISASGSASLLGSFVTNDNALTYEAAAYEKIFAYQFQSMNYLADKNLQGALVEIRRANEEQTLALENHHKELAEAEKQAEQENVTVDEHAFDNQMQALNNAAGKVKNSFQNAYTFYYSAVVREAQGDMNGAYIDYKKALEIFPENPYLQKDVWRLAHRLSMKSDLETFKKQFPFAAELKDKTTIEKQVAGALTKQGTLIVFYEQGYAPEKAEIFLPFVTYDRIHSFAFPTYLQPWQQNVALRLKTDSLYLGESSLIVDVHALAAKALQEKTFSQLVRQMIRVNTKARIQREAGQGNSSAAAFGSLFASAYSMLSERADLRSWLTLPNHVQIARFDLNVGSHKIHLSNATFSQTINVTINQGQITLVRIVNPDYPKIYTELFEL